MNRPCRTFATALLVLGLAHSASAGQVKLEIRDGRVTLDAKDATLREIFAEWARVGQTRVINAERAPGTPLTVQLEGVPEREALETLLRSSAGYLAVPRAVAVREASVYDRIMLMPGARPNVIPASGNAGISPAAGQPQYLGAGRYVPPNVVSDDQDDPLPNVQMPLPGQPQPAGAPQPGMMTPAPQPSQPGNQPNAPYNYPSTPGASTGGQPPPMQPTQSAARPGMPTTPPPPPNPIR